VQEDKVYYVYMVRCKDGSLYTGVAVDVDARIKLHNEGKGSKYTRTKRPVVLVYKFRFATIGLALREEYRIKQLRRIDKEKLIESQKLQKQEAEAKRRLGL
jgi:predicted GIY-YIG superfamily endonuclease